jgi:predicted AAA+ superfamily ATPase
MVLEALEDTRVVVLNGARQVGKSTLAEKILREHQGAVARYLDDPHVAAAAHADPVAFLRHDALMLIDEVQRVPDLWLAIKYLVDRDPRPGRFLLTGSARLLALRSIPDSMPGRSETIELWPLSQGEIDGYPDRFVDEAFAQGSDLRAVPLELRRQDYVDRGRRGGFPEAFKRDTPRRRSQFFGAYLSDVANRDVKQVADIGRAAEVRRLITLLGAHACGTMNIARLAGDLSVSAPTVRRYIEILETLYLVQLVPGWSSNVTTRAVAAPKVMFVDTGLAAHLDASVGQLLENFVLGELARQLTWSEKRARLYHYRDRDQHEVDAILDGDSAGVIGIEVKAAETVRVDDFATLRLLRDRLGDRFRAGFVLYCGPESFSFGDRLACLPISALWTSGSRGM